MGEAEILGARGKRCTVSLEACDDGVHTKTRLKALLRDRTGVHVVSRVFDSLDEALAYAGTLYQAAA
ncbi:MAG TPA: hypothetical protein VIG29_20300 [Vicinamibacteria bacterium]